MALVDQTRTEREMSLPTSQLGALPIYRLRSREPRLTFKNVKIAYSGVGRILAGQGCATQLNDAHQ
jgi:hypothetical protein